MSLNVIDGRIVEKVSTVPGQVPTIGPSFDHTDGTWVASDVYEAEFFVNVADQKLYILMGGTIFELTTGGPVPIPDLATVLAAGNTTGANNIIIDTDQLIKNPSGNVFIRLGTTSFPDNLVIETIGNMNINAYTNLALSADVDLTTFSSRDTLITSDRYIRIKGNATGTTKELNMETAYMESKYTDGTNITRQQLSTGLARTTATDGTDDSVLDVATNYIDMNVNNGTVVTGINLDNSDISITTTDSSTNTTSFIQTSSNHILAKSDDSTNSMEMGIDPNQVYIQDRSSNIFFQVNNVGIVLPKFFTPTSSADTTGVQGQLTLDDNYIYVKTTTGWKRAALSSF